MDPRNSATTMAGALRLAARWAITVYTSLQRVTGQHARAGSEACIFGARGIAEAPKRGQWGGARSLLAAGRG
jgi:hypothetical protein